MAQKIVDKLNFNNQDYQIKDSTAIVSNNSVTFEDSNGDFISLVRNNDGSFALAKTTYTKPAWEDAVLSIGGKNGASYEYDETISGTVTVTAWTNGQPVTGTPTMSIGGTSLTVTGSAPEWTGTGSYTLANGVSINATVGRLNGTIPNPSTNKVESTGTKTTNTIAKNKVGVGFISSSNANLTFSNNTSGGFHIGEMTKFATYGTAKTAFTKQFNTSDGNYVYVALPSSWNVNPETKLFIGSTSDDAKAAPFPGGWIKVGTVKTYSTSVNYDIFRTDGHAWVSTVAMDLR